MKNLFIFAALALGVATLNSCTQEDSTEVPVCLLYTSDAADE